MWKNRHDTYLQMGAGLYVPGTLARLDPLVLADDARAGAGRVQEHTVQGPAQLLRGGGGNKIC